MTNYVRLTSVDSRSDSLRFSRPVADRGFIHNSANQIQQEALIGDKLDVFPNPTNNGINIQYLSDNEIAIKIELKDLLGREIYTKFIKAGEKFYLPMDQLRNGMYILSCLRDSETISVYKIVKQD